MGGLAEEIKREITLGLDGITVTPRVAVTVMRLLSPLPSPLSVKACRRSVSKRLEYKRHWTQNFRGGRLIRRDPSARRKDSR